MIETLPTHVVDAMLNTMPMELSFVDAEDVVRYFNKDGDRIFPRPRAVIGRAVQDCHPPRSVHVVNRLLAEMKAGTRDEAAFWIDVRDRKVYIRYFAVRDADGTYLGCLEATQDITDLQAIRGERRLLDAV